MIKRFRHWYQKFFFAEEVPYGMALVRIFLPLAMLVGVVPRWFHARELYSTDGTATPLWMSYGTPALLPELSATAAVALCTLLIVCLVTASLGWRTRLSLAVALVLYTGLGLIDMVTTLTKYTVLASHALLLLTLSDCGAVWSVDAWLQRRTGLDRITDGRPTSPVWPTRLLQLMLAFCYLGAAFTKMHTPAYFSGDQMMFWMLANINFENHVGEWLSLYPPFVVVSAYLTILWEITFIALVWRKPWRGVTLAAGLLFHIMSGLMLGLLVFPLISVSLYFIFLEEQEAERLAVWVRRLARHWGLASGHHRKTSRWSPPAWVQPTHSLAAFAMIAVVTMVIGIEAEYQMDVYGERQPNGPHTLQPLDEARVAIMLGPEQPLRARDYFFGFDVGTTTMGGQLADHRENFTTGETALIQCSLNPPHPDMWVEVSLHDEANRLIRRFGQVISREMLRSNFSYTFDEALTPGEYDFVLSYEGDEIERRRFRYVAPGDTPRAEVGLTASR